MVGTGSYLTIIQFHLHRRVILPCEYHLIVRPPSLPLLFLSSSTSIPPPPPQDLQTEQIFDKIADDNIRYLRNFDQLTLQRAGGAVFSGWTEGAIVFRPTYKFTPGGVG